MASYKIQWKTSARKELKQLSKQQIPSILAAVEQLSDEPRPPGSRKLAGSHQTYRIRIGDYRVVYSVFDSVLTIDVIKVGHRKQVYRKR